MNEPVALAVRYRFLDTVIEPDSRRMTVGGREQPVSRRAFDLLLMLCESRGRVLGRDEVAARLWPGGQAVSDESLAQAIFHARSALGAQAETLVTVRGVGIRFDAPVQRETFTAPAASTHVPPATASVAGAVPTTPHRTAPRRRLHALRLAVLAAALALLAAWQARDPGWIDAGYGLRLGDVHAGRADTARLLAQALAHDNRGDRPRARALLEAIADGDARTPWPPLLLALWAVGAADRSGFDAWLGRARERVAALDDPYLVAMLRYVESERAPDIADTIHRAGAVLDLRPEAWRMHLARAHLLGLQGLRGAALAEIRQVDIPRLGNRKLEMALADRASYGDAAGAQALLERIPRGDDLSARHFLEGRVAWSRGDRAAARRAFELAARTGDREDLGSQANALAGLAAMLDGAPEAVALFEAARVGATDRRAIREQADLSALLALLHARAGDPAGARGEFALATQLAGGSSDAVLNTALVLVGLRLFPERAEPELALDPSAGVQSLLDARRAQRRGDRDAARKHLVDAVQRGALDGCWKDEARLLAAELGEPVAAEQPFDPPFPPLVLAGARLELAPAELPGGRDTGASRRSGGK